VGGGRDRSEVDSRGIEVSAVFSGKAVSEGDPSFSKESCPSDSRVRHLKRVTRRPHPDGSGSECLTSQMHPDGN